METQTVLESLTVEDVRAERARRVLRCFIEEAWPILESVPLVWNWHLEVLCGQLERISRNEIKRLLINIPPGTAKSLIVSVFWPAWEWATDPTKRYLCVSYAQDLALRDARKMRNLIDSEWYQLHFAVSFKDDANQVKRFENTEGGWRISSSIDGLGTGEHPDRLIVDDPHNAKEAESEAERKAAVDWFTGTASTRGVTRKRSTVVVMQRLHELDLSGHILASAAAVEWVHVCLPMRAEPKTSLVKTKATRPEVDRRAPGELLWPELFPDDVVRMLEVDLGSYGAAGQLQQRPAPIEGGILKAKWLKYYEPETIPAGLEAIVISVDPALKDKQQNDFWSIQAWGLKGVDRYALRRVHARLGPGEAQQQISDMHRWALEAFPEISLLVLIENAAAGPDTIRALRKKISGVVPWTAKGDKVQRAMAASPVLEAGNIIVPGVEDAIGGRPDPFLTPGWVQEMVTEWTGFPNAAHDDDVDAFTQMVIRTQGANARVGMARAEAFL